METKKPMTLSTIIKLALAVIFVIFWAQTEWLRELTKNLLWEAQAWWSEHFGKEASRKWKEEGERHGTNNYEQEKLEKTAEAYFATQGENRRDSFQDPKEHEALIQKSIDKKKKRK